LRKQEERTMARNKAKPSVIGSAERHGRIFRQARRCLIAADNRPVSTSDALAWIYPRLKSFEAWHYRKARRALARYATPIGRGAGSGRPLVWIAEASL
jgi:hypothetical protein